MKNLKHLKSGLLACLLVGISHVSLAQSSNVNPDMPDVAVTPTDPNGGYGEPPSFPPPLFVSLDEEVAAQPSVKFYPVPCHNFMTVEISKESPQPVLLKIYDLTGNVVWNGEVQATQRIDLSQLSAGIYILNDGYNTQKFQKL